MAVLPSRMFDLTAQQQVNLGASGGEVAIRMPCGLPT